VECTAKKIPAIEVPEYVDATECAHCKRLHVGNSWKTTTRDETQRLEEVVRDAIKLDGRLSHLQLGVSQRWEDKKNAMASIQLQAQLSGVPLVREATTRVRWKTSVCQDCSREKGGYFEAILQVRGAPGSDLAHHLPDIEHWLITRLQGFRDENRPNSFVTKLEKTKHGHDYYMGNHETVKQLATELAEKYGGEMDESTKLVTRKDGRDVFRWTNLVRLPPYARNDFLLVQDIPCKLISFDRRNIYLLDLNRLVRMRREINRVQPIKVIGRSKDQHDAIIVSRRGPSAQIMDPNTFKTIDVPADKIPPDAKTVPVFYYEETLYLVADPGLD
jgi:NMD protein affecting ribosome stability and mRNA decay